MCGHDNKNTILKRYKIIGNCCAAAMLCVILVSCNSSEKPVFNDDVTAETKMNNIQTSEIESEKEELPLSEFTISDEGVLTAYNGTSDVVTIPDEVVSISTDAFGASPVASEIKTIKLGKSVENIDTQAFVSLTALESIEVPEENTNYKFLDGVLFKNDSTLFFCMPNIIKDDYDMFDVFFDMISEDEYACATAQVVMEGMIATVNVTEAEEGLINFGINHNFYCTSFYANGQKLDFDKPLAYISDFSRSKMIHVYESNECILFSNTSGYGFGDTWFLLKDNVLYTKIVVPNYEEKIGNEEWYNYSVIRFYKENGLLKYERKPYKYIFNGTYSDIIWNCTGFDEFAGEIGTIKIENNEIKYCPEKSWTVKDDMVGRFLKETYDPEYQGYATLEDYLEHNAEIYKSAK